MKRVIASIGLLLLCCSTAAFASDQTDLAAFLASLTSPPTPSVASNKTDPGGVTGYDVTCTATCGGYGTVSCTVPSGTCTAVDRNCAAGQRGYVDCNGTVTFCPVCGCVEGQIMYEDGGCCSGGRQRTITNKCIDGSWERIGSSCAGYCF